jgi:hypothetical protein
VPGKLKGKDSQGYLFKIIKTKKTSQIAVITGSK